MSVLRNYFFTKYTYAEATRKVFFGGHKFFVVEQMIVFRTNPKPD